MRCAEVWGLVTALSSSAHLVAALLTWSQFHDYRRGVERCGEVWRGVYSPQVYTVYPPHYVKSRTICQGIPPLWETIAISPQKRPF